MLQKPFLPQRPCSLSVILLMPIDPWRHARRIKVPAASRRGREIALAPPLAFKLSPALHGDLGAVEFALVLAVAALLRIAFRLPRIAPRKVVKFPKGVGWQHKVPDRQRHKVDEHPYYVDPRVCGDDNQHAGETKDQAEQNQGNNLDWSDDRGYNWNIFVRVLYR